MGLEPNIKGRPLSANRRTEAQGIDEIPTLTDDHPAANICHKVLSRIFESLGQLRWPSRERALKAMVHTYPTCDSVDA